MIMEIKENPPVGGEKNNQTMKIIKLKINQFLINYFNYIIFILGTAILAAGIYFFIYPKSRQIYSDNQAIKNDLQVEYQAKINYLEAIRNLENSYKLISADDKKKIDDMLPVEAENNNGRIIAEIESIVTSNSAILNSIKIEAQDKAALADSQVAPEGNQSPLSEIIKQLPQGVKAIKIEANLSSVSYPVLKNLLKSLENNLKLFDIVNVKFNSKENKSNFIIYSYYLSRILGAEAVKNQAGAQSSGAFDVNKIKLLGDLDLTIFSSDKFNNLKDNQIIVKEKPEVGKRDPFKIN